MSDFDIAIRSPLAIDDRARSQMFALFSSVYEQVDEAGFRADLEEKDFALLVIANGAVIGFTTGITHTTRVDGQLIRYLFSGDTVVDPEHWGRGHFFTAWVKLTGTIKAEEPQVPLYWFLITKGHRTYRLMTSFFRRYVPHASETNDPWLMAIRDVAANERFGSYYDPATGLIDFGTSKGHLAPPLQDASESDGSRAVRQFMALNPEYGRGVELACITELAAENYRFLQDHFREGLRDGRAVFRFDDPTVEWRTVRQA